MKNKYLKLIALAMVACLGLAALAGCGGSGETANSGDGDNGAAAEGAALAEGATLVVGFDAEYPPYGFVGDDGQYTGFDLDLAAEVADRNGWEFQAEPIDWDAKDALLGSGAINCIWNGFTMEGREDSYEFSEPYMLNEQVIVVKAGSDIADFAGLEGATVITQVDSAALEVLEGDQADLAATFAELQTIGDYNNAFLQLDSGLVDAVACDLSIAQYQIAANPDKYTQLDEALSSEHYAVGFAKGDATAAVVTDTLKDMYADGTVEQICDKYADYGLSFDNWVLK